MAAMQSPYSMPSLEPSSPLQPPSTAPSCSPLSPSSPPSSSPSSPSSSSSDDDAPPSIEEAIVSDDDGDDDATSDASEPPSPCERFFINLRNNGPTINLRRLRARARLASAPAPGLAEPGAEEGGGEDVQVTQAHIVRKRYADDYDTSDPFVDDSDLPAELNDEAMEPVIEGFHVQRGPVPLKEVQGELRVKSEPGQPADGAQPRKKRRRSITLLSHPLPPVSMSSALQEAFGRFEAACIEAGVLEQVDQPHRRLPDDVNALFSDVIRVYDGELVALKDAGKRKELLRGLLSRLEAALGMSRASVRQKMKTLQLRWEGARRQKDIEHLTARLKANIHRDAQQYKAEVVAAAASSSSSPPPYKPKWSLLMSDLLQLSALTLAEAGAKTLAGGNPQEAEGQQVQKELWESLVEGWGGLMDAKTLGDRVRSARRARRKKEQAKAAQAKAKEGGEDAGKQGAANRSTDDRPEQKREGKDGKEGKEDRGHSKQAAAAGEREKKDGAGKDKASETKRTAEEEARRLQKWKARQEKRRLREAEAGKAVTSTSTTSSSKANDKDAEGTKKKKKKSHPGSLLSPPPASASAKGSGKAPRTSKAKCSSSPSSSSSSASASASSPHVLSSSDLVSVLPPMSTSFHLPPDESQRWSQRYFPIIIGFSGATPDSAQSSAPSSQSVESGGGAAAGRQPPPAPSKKAQQPSATR